MNMDNLNGYPITRWAMQDEKPVREKNILKIHFL